MSADVVTWRDLSFAIDDDVYEPAEDSFLLANALQERGVAADGARALDVGTGTGLAALVLARAGFDVIAVDLNARACDLARANASRNALAPRVLVLRADLADAFGPRARFDVVSFNAPYLPSGPDERIDGALDAAFHGGDEGVEVALRFVDELPRLLAPQGEAFLVLSTRGNVDRVLARARAFGLAGTCIAEERWFFEAVQVWRFVNS